VNQPMAADEPVDTAGAGPGHARRSTGPVRKVLLVVYWLCLASFLAYFWTSSLARSASPLWIAYACTVLACLAAAPRHAIVGPLVYVALAYGISSHAPELNIMLRIRLLDGVALLALAAWVLSGRPPKPHNQSTAKPLVLAALLFGWVAVCAAWATANGTAWGSFLRHDPSAFLQAGILFLVTANVAGTRRSTLAVAAVVVAIVLGRALLQGTSGIHLESYVATLLVMGVPIAALGAMAAARKPVRFAFAAAGLVMAALMVLTENRAAAVAVAAAAAMFVWQLRGPLLGRAMVGVLVVAGGVAAFVPSTYLQRFTALADPELTHQGARLDRKTVSERVQVWSAGWDMARDHPVLGVGPGNYPATLGIYLPRKLPMAAHSSYVQMVAETGFVGLTLYLLFFAAVTRLSGMDRHHADAAWRSRAGRMLQLVLVAYLAGGAFKSRHDLVLAYLVAGWALALCVTQPQLAPRSVPASPRGGAV
jgi:hypothetical protein